ncbi:hypothetical protein CALVIDRAFT_567131 [Calocera viscosa TUFC12733]|uniref:Uncharacterized protein n=1 Tax=Calocera viscosa (strain TUFC12733) TaxID=1330018 RepID=A0A167IH66_CALVF|nr:hypothetical protein CALVIDRAFT_567131 [Calocera viscosa TUFC12733]
MPTHASLPSGGLRTARHERGGSTTMTLEKAAEALASAAGGYPTLLLKGSTIGEKEPSASPEAERHKHALEKVLDAMVVDEATEATPVQRHASVPVAVVDAPGASAEVAVPGSSEEESAGGPSRIYADETHDIYLPQLDPSLPDPAAVPPTPRDAELHLRALFALEAAGMSPRMRGKQRATDDGENAQHDQRLRGLAEAAASAAASQAERELTELIGEVAKVLRKMFHLAWERDQDDGAAPLKADPIQKVQDICQISQSSGSRSEHSAIQTETLPRVQESKSEGILHWLKDMHKQLGGSAGLPPPAWAAKLGVAPDGESPYEKTLVGDVFELPTKLPADDNPEDEVDRVSLTAELPIRAWVRELLRRTDVSASQVKVAACYMIALRPHVALALQKRQQAAHSIATNQPLLHYHASPLTCPRRTLVGTLILASKFLGEKVYSMKAWARVTGLEAPDLVQSEQVIGTALKWDLWVGANVQSLRSDVFTRTLLQIVSTPGARQLGRPYPQELLNPAMVAPPADRAPLEQAGQPALPAVHGPEHAVFEHKDVPVGRKRPYALDAEAGGSSRRAQKRKAVERGSGASGAGCAVMVKAEPVDEHILLAEAY